MIPPELEAEIDDCCDKFEAAWAAGNPPSMEDFLGTASAAARPHLLWELVALERYYRRDEHDEPVSLRRIASIYPALAEELAIDRPTAVYVDDGSTLRPSGAPDGAAASQSDVQLADPSASRGLHVRCPHCSNPMEILADMPMDDVTCRTCGSTFNLVEPEGPTLSAPTLRSLGRFDLVSRLGVGGFGTVWKARDTELDRLVAIKIPRKGQLTPTDVEQFFREARAAAQLYHPNIVSVYEVGRADDTVFIVGDLVRGVALSDYLTAQRLTFVEIAQLCVPVAEALQHAHDHGVIHRDLKPSNIMIDEHGTPLIMDFGLAKRDVGEITMTVDGQIMGTPGYMSPEQASGRSHWTDRRSDIYSLGTVIYRMATGELPFRGNARMQLQLKLSDDPPDPRRLEPRMPRDLATICLKCIQRDPNNRYANANDVVNELQRFLNGEPIRARPLSTAGRAWRWARRKPALASAIALTCALAIAGPLAAWQQSQLAHQRQQRLAERLGLLSQMQVTSDKQEADIAALTAELKALRGGTSGVAETLPGWRLGLIEALVETRQLEMAARIDGGSATSRESIQSGLGLGILLAQLGRNEEALPILRTTERQLARLRASRENDLALADAHADCWQRIGQLQQRLDDDPAAWKSLEQAIAIRRPLAQDDKYSVDRQIRLLESTVQESESAPTQTDELNAIRGNSQIISELAQQWPTSPAELYRLACQLTKSDVLLEDEE
ncbi:MAG: protein kinase domain-containing protein [Bythopirellula sp.]